jgi:hypothetical protein
MPKTKTAELPLINQFLDTIRALPDAKASIDHLEPEGSVGDWRHDAKIALQIGGKSFTLFVELKKTVYPRDAQQVLWQLRHRTRSKSIPLLLAESISLGARQLLQNERVGYYDTGGSLFLPANGAYLYIDKPPPKSQSKSMRSLFSGRSAQVLHTLLVHHTEWFGVKELAVQASVSSATASEVMTELERFGWLVSRGQGPSKERNLSEPAALLDAWARQQALARPPALRRYYVPGIKADAMLDDIGKVLAVHNVLYAFSNEAAAQRYAPFLSNISQVRCRLLAGPNADAAIGELGARVVSEGANLAVIEAKSRGELLFREQVSGIWLASPIQVYLDLLRGEGRAKEMAEHMRRERIGF